MKTAAVVIDAWKLPVFMRHLDAAKYVYTAEHCTSKPIVTLMVKYEWVAELQPVVQAANAEAVRRADAGGIQEIKQQLRQQYPNKSELELTSLANMKWQRRNLRTR